MASPKMEVRLVQQFRGDFKIVIYLQSERKPELRTLGELNPGVASGTADLLNRVGMLAGLVAAANLRAVFGVATVGFLGLAALFGAALRVRAKRDTRIA